MAITKAQANANILARLQQFGGYHAITASLFADWTMEPGDIVTVNAEEQDYTAPVFQYDLTWKGSPKIDIQSTGSEKRPDPSKLSRSGYGGRRKQEEDDEARVEYVTKLEKTDRTVVAYAGAMGITLDSDGNPVIDPQTGDYVYDDQHNNSIFSQLELKPNTASLISEINGASGTISYGKVQVQPGSVLIKAINGGGSTASSITLEADVIDIQGVIAAMVSESITVGDLTATGGLTGALTGNVEGDLDGSVIGEGHSGYFESGLYVGSSFASVGDGIAAVQIVETSSGSGVYKLQFKHYGDTSWTDDSTTFSRATALTGAWSSGSFPLTITASPQGETYDIGFGTYGAHDIDLELVTNGSVAKSDTIANAIEIPLAINSLNSGQTAPTARYTKTLTASVAGLLEAKTGSDKITSNGTYTPSSGYIGFSSVEISVPSSSHSISVATQSGTYATRADMEAAYPGHSWSSLGSVSTGYRAVKATCGSSTKWYFFVGT